MVNLPGFARYSRRCGEDLLFVVKSRFWEFPKSVIFVVHNRHDGTFIKEITRLLAGKIPADLHRDLRGVFLHRVPSSEPSILTQQLDGSRQFQVLRVHCPVRDRIVDVGCHEPFSDVQDEERDQHDISRLCHLVCRRGCRHLPGVFVHNGSAYWHRLGSVPKNSRQRSPLWNYLIDNS